jgi:small-conductance mechanosensitive channel
VIESLLSSVWRELVNFFTAARLQLLIVVLIVVAAGLILTRILVAITRRLARRYLSPQYAMLIRKAIQYTTWVAIVFIVLSLLGVKIGALLGAAGIVGIAIGFASQTSMSNLISGLFLISEKPFEIGDVIKVGETTGVIHSIDLLSVKIITFDNQYVRIPNGTLLTSELTNVTRHPIRRMDINFSVSYGTDIDRLRAVLTEIAADNPLCLDEPEPVILMKDFGESGLSFLFGVWFYKTDFLRLKNSIMKSILDRFAAEGIEIPFPHLSLYAGSRTAPLPLTIANMEVLQAADHQSQKERGVREGRQVRRDRKGQGPGDTAIQPRRRPAGRRAQPQPRRE